MNNYALILLVLAVAVLTEGRPQTGGITGALPLEGGQSPLLGGNLYAWIFSGTPITQGLLSGLPMTQGGNSPVAIMPLSVPEVSGHAEGNVSPGLGKVVRHLFEGVGGTVVRPVEETVVHGGLEPKGRNDILNRPMTLEGTRPMMMEGTRPMMMEGTRPMTTGMMGGGMRPLETVGMTPVMTPGNMQVRGIPMRRPIEEIRPILGRQLIYFPSEPSYVYPNTFSYAGGSYSLIPYNYGGIGYPFGSYLSSGQNQAVA